VAGSLFIFLLSIASAKPQQRKPPNESGGIRTQNQPTIDNELYQSTKSATWRPLSGPQWFYTTTDRLYDSIRESGLFN
jgi:hypothetical protein